MSMRLIFNFTKIKTLICLILLSLVVVSACKKELQPPKIKLSEYHLQAKILKGVVAKVMAEPSAERAKHGALNMLRARVLDCKAIGKECELYSKVLNRIVQAAEDDSFSSEEILEIRGLHNKLQIEVAKNKIVLQKQWKNYREAKAQEMQK